MDPFDNNKNRRKRNPFDDFFSNLGDEDFERIFEEARRMMEETLRGGNLFKNFEPGKKFVHGFNITRGPDGKPRVQEFGNRSVKSKDGGSKISEEREPLTDIIEGDDDVAVTVELPGVEKDDIDLDVAGDSLEIKVDTPNRKYHKRIDLPCDVEPKTTKATYKNGILDVAIKRKEKKKPGEGYRVDIE